ncbi:MAG: M28 family peptidase [Chloroflexi bacterium]|nr:M28 family peptidase [Chloroflexota bacterium]
MKSRKSLPQTLGRFLNPRADLSKLGHTPSNMEGETDEVPERPIRLRHILFNVPLLLGGLIVLTLFIGVLFGPLLAPQNPYLHGRRVVSYVDGNLSSPPYPPSDQFPMGTDELGRDTLSMLLYGTRNTLVAAAFITMARLVLGLALGGLAGWNEGQMADRIVMGVIQMLIALPMLLVAVLFIYALDIRRGLTVFIIALCAVGWGEIAQYVRAEFIRIKQEPFLDSGRVVGLNSLGLAIRHVLPNVLPTLIVITLLEMGAVLMILGELGFIGVHVGGGIAVPVGDFDQEQHFALPEWGAMMAGSRAWARARPWMVIFPAIAFFVSVSGFNLLGEGLRRLIDRGLFNTAQLLNWRVIIVVALITAASVYVILTLGPAPSYRQLAEQVNEGDLMQHVEFLSAPDMNGRGIGSPEAFQAVEYITDELEKYGISAPPGGWVHDVDFTLAYPAEPPELALVDEDGQSLVTFTRWANYSESIERHGGSGETEAPITLVVFPSNEEADQSSDDDGYALFRGLDLSGRIVMVLAGNAPYNFDTEALIRGAEGVLIVSNDVKPRNQILSDDYLEHPTLPIFRITPATADTILSGSSALPSLAGEPSIEAIQEEIAGLDAAESAWTTYDLDARVRMRLQLEAPETVTGHNVTWLIDGSDANLARELVIVSCHYDGLGRAPDGTLYPGANGNASGVAVMLEIVRLWQEQGFQPRRSVLFTAWAGGEWPYSGAHHFRDTRENFLSRYNISAVIHLDRLGGNAEGGLVVRQRSGRDNLLELLDSSAAGLDVKVVEGLALRRHYQQLFDGRNGTLIATWGDPEPSLDKDTLDNINPENLSQAAQVINLTLITAAHEPRY